MNRFPLTSLLLLLLTTGAQAQPAPTPADFYCAEAPDFTPTYYGTNGGEGVCSQAAFCTFLNPELKKLLATQSEVEKKKYLRGNPAVEWLPATLTCKGKMVNDVPTCPSTEQCKADAYFKMRDATVDSEKFEKNTQAQSQDSNAAPQSGNTAGAAQ